MGTWAPQQSFKWLAAEDVITDPIAGLKPPCVVDKPVPDGWSSSAPAGSRQRPEGDQYSVPGGLVHADEEVAAALASEVSQHETAGSVVLPVEVPLEAVGPLGLCRGSSHAGLQECRPETEPQAEGSQPSSMGFSS